LCDDKKLETEDTPFAQALIKRCNAGLDALSNLGDALAGMTAKLEVKTYGRSQALIERMQIEKTPTRL